jgi:hypothetical protein
MHTKFSLKGASAALDADRAVAGQAVTTVANLNNMQAKAVQIACVEQPGARCKATLGRVRRYPT